MLKNASTMEKSTVFRKKFHFYLVNSDKVRTFAPAIKDTDAYQGW